MAGIQVMLDATGATEKERGVDFKLDVLFPVLPVAGQAVAEGGNVYSVSHVLWHVTTVTGDKRPVALPIAYLEFVRPL